jgi:hypothetical protein
MRAIHFEGFWKGWSLKIKTVLVPEMATSDGFARIKIIKSKRHIKKTCTLVFCILYSVFCICILYSVFCEFYVQVKGPTVYLASGIFESADSGALPNIYDLNTIIIGLKEFLFFRNNGSKMLRQAHSIPYSAPGSRQLISVSAQAVSSLYDMDGVISILLRLYTSTSPREHQKIVYTSVQSN